MSHAGRTSFHGVILLFSLDSSGQLQQRQPSASGHLDRNSERQDHGLHHAWKMTPPTLDLLFKFAGRSRM